MAAVTFQDFASGTNLAPEQTAHWWWNNAVGDRVWSFSVDPLPISLKFPNASYRVEIVRVQYRRNHNFNAFEREIHIWVKNTGNITTNYAIHMATIRK